MVETKTVGTDRNDMNGFNSGHLLGQHESAVKMIRTRRNQYVKQVALTDQIMEGRIGISGVEGCQHCDHASTKNGDRTDW